MADNLEIFFVAGEPSGDLQASLVAAELVRHPGVRLRGAAGPRMRAAGVVADYRSDDWGVVGLVPSLKRAPALWRRLEQLAALIVAQPPRLLLLVDFRAFNVRLAARVRHRAPQVPILYYFPPTSWDPGPRDRAWLAPLVTAVATPFAHSERLLRESGVPAWWVGHPALDRLSPVTDRAAFRREHRLPDGPPVIGLLPGSRRQERNHLAPQFLATLSQLSAELPAAAFLWSVMPGQPLSVMDRRAAALPGVQLVDDSSLILRGADLALVAMGTTTLEAAVCDCPFLATYRGSGWLWLQWKLLGVGTSLYAMPNILLGQEVVPELIQDQATPATFTREVLALWRNPARLREMRESLARVRAELGSPGASRRVAAMALALARGETLSLDQDFSSSCGASACVPSSAPVEVSP